MNINSPLQVGQILKSRRKIQGFSQQALAEKLGISQNRLSELEDSPQHLTLERLLILLNWLGLEMVIREREHRATRGSNKVEW